MSTPQVPGPHGRADGPRVGLLADPATTPGPSAELAVLLEEAAGVDPASLDAATAVGVIEGIWAYTAHLSALQATMITAMTRMPEYAACAAPTAGDPGAIGDESSTPDDSDPADGDESDDGARVRARARRHEHDPADVVASEVSAALRISPMHARGLVAESVALVTEHPATAQALEAGRIDWAKARAIMDATAEIHLTPESFSADDAQPDESVADESVAATGAARAHVEAAALSRASEQTMRQLRARLRRLVHAADPAAIARRANLARRERMVHPPRPCGDGNATMTAVGPLEDLHAVYTALDAAARHARTNRDPADDRTLDHLRFDALVDTTGWEPLRRGHLGCCAGTTCTGHDSNPSTTATSATSTTIAASAEGSARQTAPREVPPVVTRLGGRNRKPVHIAITIPFNVLVGSSDGPAELDTATGPEPLPASIARTLAYSDDATWRRLLTDPASGAVWDHGRTTYTPPAALADHIRARDRTCRFPTTSTPATSCELDHTTDYAAGGTTSHDNLAALSATAHTHKTLHAWHLDQPHPGTLHWTSPAGRTYTSTPDPPDEPDPPDTCDVSEVVPF